MTEAPDLRAVPDEHDRTPPQPKPVGFAPPVREPLRWEGDDA